MQFKALAVYRGMCGVGYAVHALEACHHLRCLVNLSYSRQRSGSHSSLCSKASLGFGRTPASCPSTTRSLAGCHARAARREADGHRHLELQALPPDLTCVQRKQVILPLYMHSMNATEKTKSPKLGFCLRPTYSARTGSGPGLSAALDSRSLPGRQQLSAPV